MKYIIELEDEPNESYFGEGNFYRCKQIPYWSISESMRNRLEPYGEAERKTEPTISEMEQVEWTKEDCKGCKYNEYPYDSGTCFVRVCINGNKYEPKDEPQYDIDKGTIKCDNCSESGSYKCSKCDGEMYFKRLEVEDEPQTERSSE